jgi:hypothetical protein
MQKCGAKTKSGKPCRHPAGFRTDHVGEGRCYLHGGRTPIKSGRYSKVNRERLGGLIAEYEADPDPLNVLPELGAARALFVDFIERYDEWREALLLWHASFNTDEDGNPLPAKPRKVLDVADAYRLLSTVAKIAQAEKRLQLDGAVSRKDLLRILTEVRRVVEAELDDTDTLNRILDGWNGIQLA